MFSLIINPSHGSRFESGGEIYRKNKRELKSLADKLRIVSYQCQFTNIIAQ